MVTALRVLGGSPGAERPRRSPDFPAGYRPVLVTSVLLIQCEARLDVSAAYLLSLCDGKRTIDGMADLVASAQRIQRETALQDIRSLVRSLAAIHVLEEELKGGYSK